MKFYNLLSTNKIKIKMKSISPLYFPFTNLLGVHYRYHEFLNNPTLYWKLSKGIAFNSFLQNIKINQTKKNPFFPFHLFFFHQQCDFPVGACVLPILVFFLFRSFLYKQALLPRRGPSETPFAKSQSWSPLQVTPTICGKRNNLCGSSLVSYGGFQTLPAWKQLL